MAKPDAVVEGRIGWINGLYRETAKALSIAIGDVTYEQVWDYQSNSTEPGARCSIWLIWYRKEDDGRTRQDVVANNE